MPISKDSPILKVNFTGASSTGKSTISEYCAKLYGEPNVPERMRDLMIERGMVIADITNDLFIDAAKLQEEDMQVKQMQAKRYLFIDSGPLVFYLGNKYSFGRDFLKLKEMALDFYKEQDVVFVCDNNIPFDAKEMRGDEGTKDILQKEIIKFLDDNSIKYTMIYGTVEEQAQMVKTKLESLDKAQNQLSLDLVNSSSLKQEISVSEDRKKMSENIHGANLLYMFVKEQTRQRRR
ncbi:MAG: ATP-binding protein [Alphaproteobacteria bacterium]|nr:ATP-binding protein [Alphaproteobacteria bacterium]